MLFSVSLFSCLISTEHPLLDDPLSGQTTAEGYSLLSFASTYRHMRPFFCPCRDTIGLGSRNEQHRTRIGATHVI